MNSTEVRMRLTQAQTKLTATRVDARPVADDSELVSELRKVFGDHTFFLGATGLHIVDPESTPTSAAAGRVVTVARWTDARRTALAPQEPEPTDVVIELDAA
jgi:hypothetical protein